MKNALRRYLSSFARLSGLDAISQIAIDQELRQIRAEALARTPRSPLLRGFKVYSQADEDGIIEAIFDEIGARTRVFAEIGASNGAENNTHYLLHKGWRGAWIEGSAARVAELRAGVEPSCAAAEQQVDLCVFNGYVRKDNIDSILAACLSVLQIPGARPEIDFLSMDIDGNDLHVLGAMSAVEPRVICVEYNAKFPPPLAMDVGYAPDRVWSGDDYFGASLQSFIDALSKREYSLVCCNAAGVNAFFVHNAALAASSMRAYEPRQLYQEARYHLIRKRSGHPASLAYLRRKKLTFIAANAL